jgi:Fe-S cluster assembly protein SufB
MVEPDWANIKYEKPDFQAIRYYAAPKVKPELASLDEVDPELLKTFEKLGISIDEQKRFRSCCRYRNGVSVKTTSRIHLLKKELFSALFPRRLKITRT